MTAWVCPKCGRVWAWWVSECNVCNAPVITSATTDAQPAPDRTALLWRVATAAQRVSYLGGQNDIHELRAALNALHDDEPPDAPRDDEPPVTRHEIRKRDAALGRAVRRMPKGASLYHRECDNLWYWEHRKAERSGHTPEEALGLDGDE